ncbi:hypothetical protein L227DRAFT_618014 [Lentinus tigrinus ALCF2SS1-6]|uniref:Uncharacterized protein n=1 Tax=Lentinus tigrinus ALCF2SS1-6 TaxID=1328759 RepID=A0A5C2RLI3_9APHY|nr:hypothetical protein L227DRAFT_618014 [Lentinus tigrinus ALCF2SS1-6]
MTQRGLLDGIKDLEARKQKLLHFNAKGTVAAGGVIITKLRGNVEHEGRTWVTLAPTAHERHKVSEVANPVQEEDGQKIHGGLRLAIMKQQSRRCEHGKPRSDPGEQLDGRGRHIRRKLSLPYIALGGGAHAAEPIFPARGRYEPTHEHDQCRSYGVQQQRDFDKRSYSELLQRTCIQRQSSWTAPHARRRAGVEIDPAGRVLVADEQRTVLRIASVSKYGPGR